MMKNIFQFNQTNRDAFVRRWALRLPRGSKVLDAGAGPCRYTTLFSECQYVASDFTIVSSDARTVDVVADNARLPFPDASFDAILCTEVLEHVPEPIAVVREMARILRAGGQLLLTAPLGSGLHQEPHHYYGGFTPFWYRKFLSQIGFHDIQIQPNGGFFKHYGQESERFSAMIDPRRLLSRLIKFTMAPIWTLTLPYLRLLMPLVCHFMDGLDRDNKFTIGYHVTSTRSGSL